MAGGPVKDSTTAAAPSSPASTATPSVTAATTAPSRPVPTGPQVARAMGAELAVPLARLGTLVQSLRANHSLPDPQLAAIDAALDEARQVAIQGQQLARLARGQLRQSHEKLALHQVVHDILLDRHATLQARGVMLRQQLRPVEVIVDPGLLVSLVGAAIDWAARRGSGLQVKLGMRNWPEHALLTVRASIASARQEASADADDLPWFLLQQTANAMEVGVERLLEADAAQVTLEFPRTVRNLSGLTTLDVETGHPADTWPAASPGRQFGGSRVLLVTDDARLQRDVGRVCEGMALRLDCVPTTRHAIRFCETSPPHLVIIDENLHDPDFDQLHAELSRRQAHFPVIEVAPTAHGFAVSSWDETSTSRIGRDAVKDRLPTVLAAELGKAR